MEVIESITVRGNLAETKALINRWNLEHKIGMENYRRLEDDSRGVWGVRDFAIIAYAIPNKSTELNFVDVKESFDEFEGAEWVQLLNLFETRELLLDKSLNPRPEWKERDDLADTLGILYPPSLPKEEDWRAKRKKALRQDTSRNGPPSEESLDHQVSEEWNGHVEQYEERITRLTRLKELRARTTEEATKRYLQQTTPSPTDVTKTTAGAAGVNNRSQETRPHSNAFKKEGVAWRIVYGDASFLLGHVKGFDYIAYLLRYPNRSIPVLELVSAVEGGQQDAAQIDESDKEGLVTEGDMRPQEILDKEGRSRYKARLLELAEMRKNAEDDLDDKATEWINEEVEKIEDELNRTTGRLGKSRTFASDAEKERLRVTNLLATAYKNIGDVCEPFKVHLEQSIEKGMVFRYEPKNEASWTS